MLDSRTEGPARRRQVREVDMEHDPLSIRHRNSLDRALDVAAVWVGGLGEGFIRQSCNERSTSGIVGYSGSIAKYLYLMD